MRNSEEWSLREKGGKFTVYVRWYLNCRATVGANASGRVCRRPIGIWVGRVTRVTHCRVRIVHRSASVVTYSRASGKSDSKTYGSSSYRRPPKEQLRGRERRIPKISSSNQEYHPPYLIICEICASFCAKPLRMKLKG